MEWKAQLPQKLPPPQLSEARLRQLPLFQSLPEIRNSDITNYVEMLAGTVAWSCKFEVVGFGSYFSSFFFIHSWRILNMYVMCFVISTPTVLQYIFILSFMPTSFFFIMSLTSTARTVRGHPLRYGQSIHGHTPKENWLFLPKQPSSANSSSARNWGLSNASPSKPEHGLAWPSVANHSCPYLLTQQPSNGQTAPHASPPHFLALTFFLPSLPPCSLSLERDDLFSLGLVTMFTWHHLA